MVLERSLRNKRVVELGDNIAAAYCTRLFAAVGADVILLEPREGCVARHAGRRFGRGRARTSGLFEYLGQGKRSVVVDRNSATGRRSLWRALATADIIVGGRRLLGEEPLSLVHSVLSTVNPSLVTLSISDFGAGGPREDWRGSEAVDLAMGGLMSCVGQPGRQPIPLPGHQASFLGGSHAAVAGLSLVCGSDPRGGFVDVSMTESVASALEGTTVRYTDSGEIRKRNGRRHGTGHPAGLYRCADGEVFVQFPTDVDWELAAVLTGDERLSDERWLRGAERVEHAEEIDSLLREWLSGLGADDVVALAQELRLPFAKVVSPAELLDDPQLRHRAFWHREEREGSAKPWLCTVPWPREERMGPAPVIGQHDREVGTMLRNAASAGLPTPSPAMLEGISVQSPRESLPLAGVRVLDLTTMWAGPYCTRLLADMGAEVIKVESLARPDGTRQEPSQFEWLNRGKKSLCVDPRTERGRQLLLDLAARCDALVESFSPRVMGNLGLGYTALSTSNPSLVMVSMSAFGSSGPYSGYVAYGPGMEAMSGLSWLTCYKEGEALLSGCAYADPVAGVHAAVAILAGIHQARREGRGAWVDLAQRECLVNMLGDVFAERMLGVSSRSAAHGMQGVYRCSGDDNWIVVELSEEHDWWRVCAAIERPDLAAGLYLGSASGRANRRRSVDSAISMWARSRDAGAAASILRRGGVTSAAVADAAMVDRDPRFNANEFFFSYPGSETRYPLAPWRVNGTRLCSRNRAGLLGEHNGEVLCGILGMSLSDCEELGNSGVICHGI